MAQWVKNPTEALQVSPEERVQSSVQHNELKDPAMPQLQHRLQLRLGFNPWPGNFHTPKKKKNVEHWVEELQ